MPVLNPILYRYLIHEPDPSPTGRSGEVSQVIILQYPVNDIRIHIPLQGGFQIFHKGFHRPGNSRPAQPQLSRSTPPWISWMSRRQTTPSSARDIACVPPASGAGFHGYRHESSFIRTALSRRRYVPGTAVPEDILICISTGFLLRELV